MNKLLCVATLLSACLCNTTHADDKAKIVFISGTPSHGRLKHEHRAGNMILAQALNDSGLHVNAVLVPHYGYPEDISIFDDAATIVIFCTGHGGHVLNKHLDEFDRLMKRGTGVVISSKTSPHIRSATA
jgi:L-asparaginase/Glu-tRNA(Gln) amidotransferase subunit D